MDALMTYVNSTSIVTFGLALAVGVFILKPGQKKYRLPPYPWTRVPVIGNIFSLLWAKDKAFELFYKTSKTEDYTKVFMIQLGGLNICVLNDIEVVREALMKKAADFANRPSMYSITLLTEKKDIIFGEYGKVWRFHRKVGHMAMRNFASGEVLEKIVQNATNATISAMKREGSKPFTLKPYIEMLVFNFVSGISFGRSYSYDDPDFEKFKGMTKDFLDGFGSGLPADVFPWMSIIPFQGRKLQNLIKVFMDLLESELQSHKETFDPDNLRDLTDYLLLTQKEAEEEDKEMKGVLTDKHLVMTIFDIFGAGLDTINATLQAAIADTIMFPDVQEKLHSELDNVLGGREPTIADRRKMPMAEAFLCESMRFHTFAALGLPLATTCDTTIANYELPKDTMVMINFWALHHDSDQWDAPSEFRLSRFLDDSDQLCQRPGSFMPFSAGKRVCLGENLAKTQMLMSLPMLLQKFKFLPAPDFEFGVEDSGLANLPKAYNVVVQARN